ncbi:MAG: hypothetical protein K0A98_01805 [Trueperaceae bacterium]|nr:hypothetical protein [Trueperaceae bacterium]
MPTRRLALLLALTLAVAGIAPAQGLLDLAPDSAVLVLDVSPDAGPPAGLVAALEELDWDAAGDALGRLAQVLGGEALDGMGGEADLLGEIADACPAAADAVEGLEWDGFLTEGLLLLSLTPFAPTPHGLALARVADEPRAAALQDALVGCFGGTRLEQDGVALEVLFDGEDLPLIVTRVGGVFVAGTEPNLVRGVVRRAGGAAEPALAGTPLGAALARLEAGGVGFGLDLAGLGGVANALAGAVPPEAADLFARAVAAIETLGVVAGRVGWTDDGLRFEQVHAWPDAAPDAALAALLADPRRAERPAWIPAGAVGASASLIPLRGIVDYLDGWLAALEEPLGARVDLRGLAADALDLDLDAALLSWIGETLQVVQLEPYGTDLRGWVQGPARLVVVPVLNEDLARTGLAELGEGGLRLLAAAASLAADPLGMGGDPFGDPFADPFASGPGAGDAAIDALFGPGAIVATRETVGGLDVDRVRVGPTLDMAVAIVDGHLVLATPFRALRTLLDLRAGAPDATADPGWRAALGAWPPEARDVGLLDAPAVLRGLADLADLFAQPLASTLFVVASEGVLDGLGGGGDGWDDGWDDFGGWGEWDDDALTPANVFNDLPYDFELDASTATPLVVGDLVTGELDGEAPHARYTLVGVRPGDTVEVEMTDESGWLDTYLYVFDGDTGELLFDNDDAPGTDRSFVAFVAEPGVRYDVLASSFGGFGEGAYRLGVRVRADDAPEADAAPADDPFAEAEETEPAEPIEPPTFAELLAAADLLPRALEILAERSGFAVSTATLEGDALVTRWHLPLR